MCYGEGLEPRLFLSMYIHVPLKMSYVHVPFITCHYNVCFFDMEGMLGHVRDVAQDFGICSYMYVHVHGSVFLEFPVARICMPIMCWSWNVRKSRWYLEPEYRDILHQLPHDCILTFSFLTSPLLLSLSLSLFFLLQNIVHELQNAMMRSNYSDFVFTC